MTDRMEKASTNFISSLCDEFRKHNHIPPEVCTNLKVRRGLRNARFSKLKHERLPRQCKECEWQFACHGECPKNRFLNDKYGEPGLNYLCEGYQMFFRHVAPYMDFMKNELVCGRAPANVMKVHIG